MSKYLVAGILERETIVNVENIPIDYRPVTTALRSIHTGVGGDSYNEAIALKWLGDYVDFFSVIGSDEDPSIINRNGNDITLNTEYIMPILEGTPANVIFYDKKRNQQRFEDVRNIRDIEYDIELFKRSLPTADTVVLANANFCRPLLSASKLAGKKIAVNIRRFSYEKEQYNECFLRDADILYLSDDGLDQDPYDFVKYIVEKYQPEIVILGQGKNGVLLYNSADNTYTHHASVKTNEIVNTVGAGNALFSCFLHYYNNTKDPFFSIRNAILFASYKIGFTGSSNGFMTEKQIEDWRGLIFRENKVLG